MAEQTARSFQQVDLVLKDVATFIDQAGYDASSMGGRISHRYMADRISGVQQIGNLIVADADGHIVNASHCWPAPASDISSDARFRNLRDTGGNDIAVSDPDRVGLTGTGPCIWLEGYVIRKASSAASWRLSSGWLI